MGEMNQKDELKRRARMEMRQLREIILEIDPEGFRQLGCPDDEYEYQENRVYSLLTRGITDEAEIAKALAFEGLKPSPRSLDWARRILAWWQSREG